MLHFFEEITLLSIDEKLKENKMLTLYKLEESKVNKQCPVAYAITLRAEFLKKMSKPDGLI